MFFIVVEVADARVFMLKLANSLPLDMKDTRYRSISIARSKGFSPKVPCHPRKNGNVAQQWALPPSDYTS
jgi:hypothetical protein